MLLHLAVFAAVFACESAGNSNAARTAMMALTTRSSMRVKASLRPQAWLSAEARQSIFRTSSDGYFVMLAPLSRGQHTIHFTSAFVFTEEEDGFDFSFSLDITYRITVQ